MNDLENQTVIIDGNEYVGTVYHIRYGAMETNPEFGIMSSMIMGFFDHMETAYPVYKMINLATETYENSTTSWRVIGEKRNRQGELI